MTTPVTDSRSNEQKAVSAGTTEFEVHRAQSVSAPAGSGILRWVFLLIAFGLGWLAANFRNEQGHKEGLEIKEAADARAASSVSVTVEPVCLRPVQRTVEALGTLHGFESVTLSARIEGRVRKVCHDVADQVKPGELLLEIDPTDYLLSVQQSDRALQVELAKLGLKEPPAAKMDLEKIPVVSKARSMLEYARTRNDRISRLAATKNSSAEDVDNAARDLRTAQAEYDNQIIQAESDLATIQMKIVELQVAREQLAHTKVIVPTPTLPTPDGGDVVYAISHRSISEGTVVRPGMELYRIVICQTLKLRVPIPERHSSEIQLNQQVNVFTSTASTPFAGTVTRINPTVEPTTRTFQVEIQVPNSSGALKPGSFAKAEILTRIEPHAVTVPLSALVQFAGVTKVFLAENGHAKEVQVTTGYQTTEWVEIIEPTLTANASVITSGQTAIANETSIIVREATANVDRTAASKSADRGLGNQADRGARE